MPEHSDKQFRLEPLSRLIVALSGFGKTRFVLGVLENHVPRVDFQPPWRASEIQIVYLRVTSQSESSLKEFAREALKRAEEDGHVQ